MGIAYNRHLCYFQGFAVQAAVTQEGPFANWSKHLADPFGYNIVTLLASDEGKVSL